MIEVFLAGEGRNELGGWCVEPSYRDPAPAPGVLEALARQVAPSGWCVRDAMQWKNIPKLAVGSKGKGVERKAILAARLHAMERGCAVLMFSRDRDGSKNTARQHEVEQTLAELASEDCIAIVGGIAVERLESWLLAVSGRTGTESLRVEKTDSELEALGVPAKDTAAMVELVERRGTASLPSDAASLSAWLQRAGVCLQSLG
ncbi:MAG TPA: hypothetical protein VM869_37045 [Enhygromyxa sp.]|nr:hypothetical protein [Enhygromyxa sp.]